MKTIAPEHPPDTTRTPESPSGMGGLHAEGWEPLFWRIFPVFPFLIGILLVGLFEWYHRDLADSEIEEARQLLIPAANRLLNGFDPRRILGDAIREKQDSFSPKGDPVLDQTRLAELEGKILDPIRSLLKQDADVLMFGLFDEAGKLVRKTNLGDTTENWEGLWYLVYRFRYGGFQRLDGHPEFLSLFPVLKKFSKRFATTFLLNDLFNTVTFEKTLHTPDGRDWAVALRHWAEQGDTIFNGKGEYPERKSGFFLAVDLNGLEEGVINRRGLLRIPSELSFAYLIGPTGHVSMDPNIDEAFVQANTPDQTGAIETRPDGIFYLAPIPSREDNFLVVGKRRSVLFRISPRHLRMVEVIPLVLSLFLGWVLHTITSGGGFGTFGLAAQIAGFLGFAVSVPVFLLLWLGYSRLINLESVERHQVESNLMQTARNVDLSFRNTIESTCSTFLRITRELGRTTNPSQVEKVLERYASETLVMFCDREGNPFFPPSQREGSRKFRGIYLKQLKGLIQSYLDTIASARGGNEREERASKKTVPILEMDDLVDKNFIPIEVFKFPNRLTWIRVKTRSECVFSAIVEGKAGNVRGILIVQLNYRDHATRYIEQLIASQPAGIHLLAMHPNFCIPGLFNFATLYNLCRLVLDEGQSQLETVRVGERDFLVLAHFPRFLRGLVPGAAQPMKPLRSLERAVGKTVWGTLALAALAGLFTSRLFYLALIRPINKARGAVERVLIEDFTHRLPIDRLDELGALANSFNGMMAGLQQREKMRRFVSDSAWESTQESLAGTEARGGAIEEVAILFSDIRGFTTLSEKHPVELVVAMLNDYFTAMDGCIRSEGGEIFQLIGDAIFVVFKARKSCEIPAKRAVSAAFAMRQALGNLNAQRSETGLFTIESGIGIHFGKAVLGRVGASSGRLGFTALGPTLETAVSLEAQSKQGRSSRIIVSPEVLALIDRAIPASALSGDSGSAWELSFPGTHS